MEKYLKTIRHRVNRITLLFTADKPIKTKYGIRVYYNNPRTKGWGCLNLPDGWQDLERTWTGVDIFWEDKYDCKNAHGRAMQLVKVSCALRLWN